MERYFKDIRSSMERGMRMGRRERKFSVARQAQEESMGSTRPYLMAM